MPEMAGGTALPLELYDSSEQDACPAVAAFQFNHTSLISKDLTSNIPRGRLTTKNKIRILDLLPGNLNDVIECEIRVATLGSGEEYEALSYVWGETSDTQVIKISGRDERVTSNLRDALNRIRYPNKKRAVWIDQICINQWDNEEKAEQVNIMRLIYKNCSQCLIWLGEIEGAGFSITDARAALKYFYFAAAPNEHPHVATPLLLSSGSKGQKARKALQEMIDQNLWWFRIWTVQEAILPPSATIFWGPLTIPWKVLEDAAYRMCRPGFLSPKISRALARHPTLFDSFLYPVRGLAISKAGENPLNTLRRWRYRDATDSRDKIYALISLFPSNPFPNAQSCSYDVSPWRLYACITLDLIKLEGGLRPLIGLRGEPQVTPNLPTWAVDMTCYKYSKKRCWKWWNHSHRYEVFTADGNSSLTYASQKDNTILSLRGIYVDRIIKIGDVLGEETWENLSAELLIKTVKEWRHLLERLISTQQSAGMYTGGGLLRDAFWKTILGDLIMREFPVRRTTIGDGNALHAFLESGSKNETYRSLRDMVVNQSFFITESGYIGIGPPATLVGDEVWILFGGQVPFVLRRGGAVEAQQLTNSRARVFVGDAYVHGIMDGEAVKQSDAKVYDLLIF